MHEADVVYRMMYQIGYIMFFVGHRFVSCLLYTLKLKKIEPKNFFQHLFFQPCYNVSFGVCSWQQQSKMREMLEELRIKVGMPREGHDANIAQDEAEDYGYRSTLTTVDLNRQYENHRGGIQEPVVTTSLVWSVPAEGSGTAVGGRPPVPRQGCSSVASTENNPGSFRLQDSVEMGLPHRGTSPEQVVNVLTIEDHQFDGDMYNSSRSYHLSQKGQKTLDMENSLDQPDTQVGGIRSGSGYRYENLRPNTQERENPSFRRSSYQDRKNREKTKDTLEERLTTQVENCNCSSSHSHRKSRNRQKTTQDGRNSQTQVENTKSSSIKYHHQNQNRKNTNKKRNTWKRPNSNCQCENNQGSQMSRDMQNSQGTQKINSGSQNRKKTSHKRRNTRRKGDNANCNSTSYHHHHDHHYQDRKNSVLAQSVDDGYDEFDDVTNRSIVVRHHPSNLTQSGSTSSSTTTRRHRRHEYTRDSRREDDGLSVEEQSFTPPIFDPTGLASDNPFDPDEQDHPILNRAGAEETTFISDPPDPATGDNPLDPAAKRGDHSALDRTWTLSEAAGEVSAVENGNGDGAAVTRQPSAVSMSSYRDPRHDDVSNDAGDEHAAAAADHDDDDDNDVAEDDYEEEEADGNAPMLDTLSEYQQRLERTNFRDEQPEQQHLDDDDDDNENHKGFPRPGGSSLSRRPTARFSSAKVDNNDHTEFPSRRRWSSLSLRPTSRSITAQEQPATDDSDDDDDDRTVSSSRRRVAADKPEFGSAVAATPAGAEPVAAESPSDSIDVSELEEDEYLE